MSLGRSKIRFFASLKMIESEGLRRSPESFAVSQNWLCEEMTKLKAFKHFCLKNFDNTDK
jgi:hypothetical protein